MAISHTDIVELIAGFKDIISKETKMMGNGQTPSQRADKAKEQQILKDNNSALKYLKDVLRKNGKLIEETNFITKASNKVFTDAIQSASNLSDLSDLPNSFKKILDQSGSTLLKTMSQSASTIEGMFATQEKIESLPQVKELLQSFVDGTNTFEQVRLKIEKLGYTNEETSTILNKFNHAILDSDKYIKNNNAAIALGQQTVNSFDEEIRTANNSVRKFGDITTQQADRILSISRKTKSLLFLLGKEVYSAAQASMRFGTEMNLVQSRLAGMAPAEYAQLQAENRQAINALTGNFEEFDNLISNSNWEIIKFTGSLTNATQLAANIITTSRLLGDANINTTQFVDSQTKMFAMFNRQLSMTSDEFAEMNKRLVQDADIRNVLYRQNEQTRKAHFEDLQMSIKTYRSWGLLQDQAENLAKTLERTAGKGPRERMREAARLQAVLGAMGMGGEGQRARELLLKGARRGKGETAELANILKGANEITSQRLSKSFESELLTTAMIQRASLEEYLGPRSMMVDSILGKGAAMKNPTVDAVEQWMSKLDTSFGSGSDIVKNIVGAEQTLESFLRSEFIVALVGAMTASNLLSGLGKKSGKWLSSAEGAGIKGLGKFAGMASKAAGVVGSVAMVGKDVYDLATGEVTRENIGGVAGGGAGAIIGGIIGSVIPVVGTAVGAAAGAAIGNWGGEQLGKWFDEINEPMTKSAEIQKQQNEKMLKSMEKLQEAIESGNQAAIETAKNTLQTQMAINGQTQQQKENSEKDREQESTKLRQLYFRNRGPSTTSPR